jgi:catechol 2,3-dioxygenase-like lactoylglutathione lyase family enzyme
MILNLRHTGLVVKDLQASLDFYIKKLGFTVKVLSNEDSAFIDTILGLHDSELTTVKLVLKGGAMIELLDFKENTTNIIDRKIIDTGPTHMAFTVDDLDETYKSFSENGIEFISEPKISPDGFAKVAFCSAPEGTYIELVELLSEPLIESK